MGFIIGAIKIIFVLGFLILIHEGGHFIVAKACKVIVKEFAIGFGPKIFSYQGTETKYTLRLIPLGGFCDMLGENERKNEKGSFSNADVKKRIAIVLAGPFINIIFGFLVYFLLIAINFNQASLQVKEILPECKQNLYGLQENDEIIKINGKKVHLPIEVTDELDNIENENVSIEIKRDNEIKNIDVKATLYESKYVGIYFDLENNESNFKIEQLDSEGPAQEAGLKKGDYIISINDLEIKSKEDIEKALESEELTFSILRKDEKKSIKVTPTKINSFYLGIKWMVAESNVKNRVYYGFWQSEYYLEALVENILKLISGNVNKNQMMGPIGISEIIVETKGISQYIYFLSIISISLGVSNLLPIPALDGGKFLLLIIEAIRRKPLDEKMEISIQLIGFSILILLSIYISFNDISRIF